MAPAEVTSTAALDLLHAHELLATPAAAAAWMMHAKVLRTRGDHASAWAAIDRAISGLTSLSQLRRPWLIAAWTERGTLELAQNREADALESFNQAQVLADQAEIHRRQRGPIAFGLAQAYLRLDQAPLAEQHLQAALTAWDSPWPDDLAHAALARRWWQAQRTRRLRASTSTPR